MIKYLCNLFFILMSVFGKHICPINAWSPTTKWIYMLDLFKFFIEIANVYRSKLQLWRLGIRKLVWSGIWNKLFPVFYSNVIFLCSGMEPVGQESKDHIWFGGWWVQTYAVCSGCLCRKSNYSQTWWRVERKAGNICSSFKLLQWSTRSTESTFPLLEEWVPMHLCTGTLLYLGGLQKLYHISMVSMR